MWFMTWYFCFTISTHHHKSKCFYCIITYYNSAPPTSSQCKQAEVVEEKLGRHFHTHSFLFFPLDPSHWRVCVYKPCRCFFASLVDWCLLSLSSPQASYRPFLRQLLEEVFHPDRPECPDVEHMSGGLTDLLKTGFSMFMKVSRHPRQTHTRTHTPLTRSQLHHTFSPPSATTCLVSSGSRDLIRRFLSFLSSFFCAASLVCAHAVHQKMGQKKESESLSAFVRRREEEELDAHHYGKTTNRSKTFVFTTTNPCVICNIVQD